MKKKTSAARDRQSKSKTKVKRALDYLTRHFGKASLEELTTATRKFPVTARADLQRSLEKLFSEEYEAKLVGVHRRFIHDALTFSQMLETDNDPVVLGPLHHDEVDTGEAQPERCLNRGLYLARSGKERFALVVAKSDNYTSEAVHIEVAVEAGEAGLELSQAILQRIEDMVHQSGSYKGKVISLAQENRYSGKSGSVKVHKLRTVEKNEVILPESTLELLDRNVMGFIEQRQRLKKLNMQLKKGLLFYGPPGTGKTHTVHYLAGQMKDHTTLLVTAEQVGLLPNYVQLARFLQPSMVIIEDVDLIARSRVDMRSACEETMLNFLLNEMDGLKEDAEVLFILTTNHPEALEAALASRPGRVDQAIEFPLPDADGREKLVSLYGRNLKIGKKLSDLIVKQTDRASPAFIKELMRRSAQYMLRDNGKRSKTDEIKEDHVRCAMEELLFSGGSLNRKLLGGAREIGWGASKQ